MQSLPHPSGSAEQHLRIALASGGHALELAGVVRSTTTWTAPSPTMEASERLSHDRPAIPIPDFIERELARMDELETAPDSLL